MEKRTCDTCDAQGYCVNRLPARKACNQYQRMPDCATCRKRGYCAAAHECQWCPSYQEEPSFEE